MGGEEECFKFENNGESEGSQAVGLKDLQSEVEREARDNRERVIVW